MTVDAMALAVAAPTSKHRPGHYVTHFGDFRTGDLWGSLPCSGFQWTSELRANGSVSVTVPASTEAADLWSALQDGRAMVAVEWAEDFGRRILWASPVVARSLSKTSVTLAGSGMFGHLGKRLLVQNVSAANIPTTAHMTFTGDQGTMMRGVVAQALSLPDGDLPINLEAARSGTRTQSYDGFDLIPVAQRVSELAEQQPGTDFAFLPRFADTSNTSIVWDMVTGTEAVPLLNLASSAPIIVDGTAPGQTTVKALSWDSSTANMGTHVYSKGGGIGGAVVIREATDTALTSQGWPRIDAVVNNNSANGDTVQAYADAGLALVKRPARAVKVTVDRAFWWGQQARLGDSVRVMYTHPIAGSIDITSRLFAESADVASPYVDLTLADTLAEEVS